MIMLLNLLEQLGVEKVAVAGADGYKSNKENYYDSRLTNATVHDREFNQEVGAALKELRINIEFITTSEYTKYM